MTSEGLLREGHLIYLNKIADMSPEVAYVVTDVDEKEAEKVTLRSLLPKRQNAALTFTIDLYSGRHLFRFIRPSEFSKMMYHAGLNLNNTSKWKEYFYIAKSTLCDGLGLFAKQDLQAKFQVPYLKLGSTRGVALHITTFNVVTRDGVKFYASPITMDMGALVNDSTVIVDGDIVTGIPNAKYNMDMVELDYKDRPAMYKVERRMYCPIFLETKHVVKKGLELTTCYGGERYWGPICQCVGLTDDADMGDAAVCVS